MWSSRLKAVNRAVDVLYISATARLQIRTAMSEAVKQFQHDLDNETGRTRLGNKHLLRTFEGMNGSEEDLESLQEGLYRYSAKRRTKKLKNTLLPSTADAFVKSMIDCDQPLVALKMVKTKKDYNLHPTEEGYTALARGLFNAGYYKGSVHAVSLGMQYRGALVNWPEEVASEGSTLALDANKEAQQLCWHKTAMDVAQSNRTKLSQDQIISCIDACAFHRDWENGYLFASQLAMNNIGSDDWKEAVRDACGQYESPAFDTDAMLRELGVESSDGLTLPEGSVEVTIRGLPQDVTLCDLNKLLDKFEIVPGTVTIGKWPNRSLGDGYAYVTFANEEAASAAIEELEGHEFGKKGSISLKETPDSPVYVHPRPTLLIDGLNVRPDTKSPGPHPHTIPQRVFELFRGTDVIVESLIVKAKLGRAYVSFPTTSSADVASRNARKYIEEHGKEADVIRVRQLSERPSLNLTNRAIEAATSVGIVNHGTTVVVSKLSKEKDSNANLKKLQSLSNATSVFLGQRDARRGNGTAWVRFSSPEDAKRAVSEISDSDEWSNDVVARVY